MRFLTRFTADRIAAKDSDRDWGQARAVMTEWANALAQAARAGEAFMAISAEAKGDDTTTNAYMDQRRRIEESYGAFGQALEATRPRPEVELAAWISADEQVVGGGRDDWWEFVNGNVFELHLPESRSEARREWWRDAHETVQTAWALAPSIRKAQTAVERTMAAPGPVEQHIRAQRAEHERKRREIFGPNGPSRPKPRVLTADGLVLTDSEVRRLRGGTRPDDESYRPEWDDTNGDYWGGLGAEGAKDMGIRPADE
jgi:hypothetical protein